MELGSVQLEMPLGGTSDEKPNGNGSSFGDPAFSRNKFAPIHRWVPWIAGFSYEFVRSVTERYLPERGIILDPFAGVGTTLVEGIRAGHDVVGFETNPYAAWACSVKCGAHKLDTGAVEREMHRLKEFFAQRVSAARPPLRAPPRAFRTRSPFYSGKILNKVLIFQDFIDTVKNEGARDLFRLAFASTMVSYSNYSYEPSLGRRVSAGKGEINDYPVLSVIVSKLRQMLDDIVWFRGRVGERSVTSRVINDSCFNYGVHLAPETVDLIVTSPPYLNNYHYNRNTRPHLYWLGFVRSPKDMRPLEEANFGKFWQTVREKKRMDLAFNLPDTDMEAKLEALRKTNTDKGIYGGLGWANYAVTYFNDCWRLATTIHCALKPRGRALIVIGNSILQGIMFPTDEYVARISQSLGLELVGIDIPRKTRVGNSIIRSEVRSVKAGDSHRLYEAVVELRKP